MFSVGRVFHSSILTETACPELTTIESSDRLRFRPPVDLTTTEPGLVIVVPVSRADVPIVEMTPIAAEVAMIKAKKATAGTEMPDLISNH
jgi:hypothetical protein